MKNDRILLVEPDKKTRLEIAKQLEDVGYQVEKASTIEKGEKLFEKVKPYLVITAVTFSDGNGLEFCKEIRSKGNTRILILNACNRREDMLDGFRAGCDDYLRLPFDSEELLLRVASLLRRNVGCVAADAKDSGSLECHAENRKVLLKGETIRLTPIEYSVFEILYANEGNWVPANEIYRICWNCETNGNVSTVHNHIYCLRKKLEKANISISCKRNSGYMICGKS